MKEKLVYTCEICNGTYSIKEFAEKCEKSGYPKYYDMFVGKWIITPLQILKNIETEDSSVVESNVIWFPVRIESNQILSPANYDLLATLKFIPISHSLKFSSRSFSEHNILKNFLEFAIIVEEPYWEHLNELLVENEICRASHIGNEGIIEKVQTLMKKIIIEQNITLPNLDNVDKYEYKSRN